MKLSRIAHCVTMPTMFPSTEKLEHETGEQGQRANKRNHASPHTYSNSFRFATIWSGIQTKMIPAEEMPVTTPTTTAADR
ncbi:MAG: hypothetical protein JWQ64_2041 [Subtercola sp.]|jgi:hypothetical protein|nr:hypothetical protein [Subtercola sp.]